MGVNLKMILTTINLNQLLESILGKLIIEKQDSEIIEVFEHQLHKTCYTCPHKLTNGCPLTKAV